MKNKKMFGRRQATWLALALFALSQRVVGEPPVVGNDFFNSDFGNKVSAPLGPFLAGSAPGPTGQFGNPPGNPLGSPAFASQNNNNPPQSQSQVPLFEQFGPPRLDDESPKMQPQAPQYSAPAAEPAAAPAPAPAPAPEVAAAKGGHAPSQSYGHSYHEEHDDVRPYEFSYIVKDPWTGQHFGRREKSDGENTKGQYIIHLPDGRKQTVDYNADWKHGFNADVKYEGFARYPEPTQSYHPPPHPTHPPPPHPTHPPPPPPTHPPPPPPTHPPRIRSTTTTTTTTTHPPPKPTYGAPPQPTYGAPPEPSYGAPPEASYGAPPEPSYGAPPPQESGGYGSPGEKPTYGTPLAKPLGPSHPVRSGRKRPRIRLPSFKGLGQNSDSGGGNSDFGGGNSGFGGGNSGFGGGNSDFGGGGSERRPRINPVNAFRAVLTALSFGASEQNSTIVSTPPPEYRATSIAPSIPLSYFRAPEYPRRPSLAFRPPSNDIAYFDYNIEASSSLPPHDDNGIPGTRMQAPVVSDSSQMVSESSHNQPMILYEAPSNSRSDEGSSEIQEPDASTETASSSPALADNASTVAPFQDTTSRTNSTTSDNSTDAQQTSTTPALAYGAPTA